MSAARRLERIFFYQGEKAANKTGISIAVLFYAVKPAQRQACKSICGKKATHPPADILFHYFPVVRSDHFRNKPAQYSSSPVFSCGVLRNIERFALCTQETYFLA